MAILKVARMGHPILRKKARPLTVSEIKSDKIQRLIQDMIDTVREYGGIGLAAPQVHESVQLALIEIGEDNPRYPGASAEPLRVIINPKITVLDKSEQGFWEGCLSVPDLRGFVLRPRKIRVDYTDVDGKPATVEAEDFQATVFQHELDHLDGTLYVDRIQDKTKLTFVEEYQRYHIGDGEELDE